MDGLMDGWMDEWMDGIDGLDTKKTGRTCMNYEGNLERPILNIMQHKLKI